jgi:hypothetical protein
MSMAEWYDKHYFFCDEYGGKEFTDERTGEKKAFGYAQGGLWNFKGILDKLIALCGKPDSVLDIGAGCGGFVATCNSMDIEASGLEFSQYAVDNAILNAKPFLKFWNIEQTPWPVTHQYDWVTAIDLFEHLFADRVEEVIKEVKRVAKKFIIAKICTAQRPHEVWAARRASLEQVLAQAKSEGFEWLIVSGHVNSQFPNYWLEKCVDNNWKQRSDLAERLKVDLKLPDDWRATLILKNYSYDLEEEI